MELSSLENPPVRTGGPAVGWQHRIGFGMGAGIPMVFPKWVMWVQVW